jgi:hypothetical protein
VILGYCCKVSANINATKKPRTIRATALALLRILLTIWKMKMDLLFFLATVIATLALGLYFGRGIRSIISFVVLLVLFTVNFSLYLYRRNSWRR